MLQTQKNGSLRVVAFLIVFFFELLSKQCLTWYAAKDYEHIKRINANVDWILYKIFWLVLSPSTSTNHQICFLLFRYSFRRMWRLTMDQELFTMCRFSIRVLLLFLCFSLGIIENPFTFDLQQVNVLKLVPSIRRWQEANHISFAIFPNPRLSDSIFFNFKS